MCSTPVSGASYITNMKTEEQEESKDDGLSLLKIIEDFRKSLKEEFADFLEKPEEQKPSQIKISDTDMVSKTGKTSHQGENTRDLSKRKNGKYAQSVLLDPHVISKLRSNPKDGRNEDRVLKQTALNLKDEPSSLNSEATKKDNTALKISAPVRANDNFRNKPIAFTSVEGQADKKDIHKVMFSVQKSPEHQIEHCLSNNNSTSLSKLVPQNVSAAMSEGNETSRAVQQRDNNYHTSDTMAIVVTRQSHNPRHVQQIDGAPSPITDVVHEVTTECEISHNNKMSRQTADAAETLSLKHTKGSPVTKPKFEEERTVKIAQDSDIVKPVIRDDVDIGVTEVFEGKPMVLTGNVNSRDRQTSQPVSQEFEPTKENTVTTVTPNSLYISGVKPTRENTVTTVTPNSLYISGVKPTRENTVTTVTPNSLYISGVKPTRENTVTTVTPNSLYISGVKPTGKNAHTAVTPNSLDTNEVKLTNAETTDTTVTPNAPYTSRVKPINRETADTIIQLNPHYTQNNLSPLCAEKMSTSVARVPPPSLQDDLRDKHKERQNENTDSNADVNSSTSLHLSDIYPTHEKGIPNTELKETPSTFQHGGRVSSSDSDYEAQAQAKAEQRKNTDVHMKFGSDGLHIQTDNDDNSSQPDQRMLMPPQQLQLPSFSHHGTPLYDNYDVRVPGDESAGFAANKYQNNYTTSLPDFSGAAHVFREPPDGRVYDSYSSNNGNNIQISRDDNILGHYNSQRDNRNSDLLDDPTQPDLVNRRRRLGRDHTNYVLPPNLDLFKDKKIKYENNHGGPDDGPPGLLLPGNDDNFGDENGLKLVVVDETDDEDDNVHLDSYQDGGNSKLFKDGYTPRSNSDVFPIDKNAVDRDLYKQVYDPGAETGKPNRSPSLQINNGLPTLVNTESANGAREIPIGKHQHEHGSKHSRPGFVYRVTDYDSETATDTGRTSSGTNQTFNSRHKLRSLGGSISNSNNSLPYEHLPSVYGQHQHEKVRGAPASNSSQHLYSISQMDYDRYTNSTSQLSTVTEDVDRGIPHRSTVSNKPHGLYNDVKSRTFVVPSSSVSSSHVIKDARQQDGKTLGPGYKFQVNKYNVVKRASILNRAEQLIDARRGQLTDRSDSSDELERIDEDDNEDSDLVDDMSGPRHRSLKHLQRRVYDDSTSYNSSDDVLHNMRYHPRGPVSQAARRARLTSVNARLKKQKRMRVSRRQILPPPPITSEDESSSGSSTDRPMSNRQPHESARYEELSLPDLHSEGNQQITYPRDASPGPKGRRAMFFRNGDIHYKPKQVLISNKTYTNLEKLLVDLSSMVETSTGVKYIFSWPEGREIKSITEFENGKYYVCSSTSRLQRVDYGNSKENHWKVGKIDRKENFLFQQAAKLPSPLRRPRVLTVISNLNRDSREKLILNTNSQMNFEDIFNDISNMINIPNPPVKTLYTERKPHQKVESYSQLIRDFADHDNFIACGEELVPVELFSRRPGQPPEAVVYRMKKGPRKTAASGAGRFQDDQSVSSTRSMDGRNDMVNYGEQGRVRRRKQDSVKVDINGKVREFFPPTQLNENDDGLKPDKMLKLDWVYGYRGRDVKQNLAVLPSSGELIYFVAGVAVVYNKKFSSQRHYLGHSEEITCLTVHPNGRFIATGQVSGKTPETGAHVRIWDGVSLSTYAVIGLGIVQQGVASISFSEKVLRGMGGVDSTPGDLVMVIDDSDRHVLTIWEWQTEKLVARTSTTSEPVVSGSFYPFDENLLVTYGKEHIHFWRMFWDKGGKIMRDKLSGNFQGQLPKFVTAVCFSTNGDVVTGDTSGAILVWTRDSNSVFAINRNISAQTRKAHKKSVSALCMLGDGTLLSGGGNVVKAWDTINNYALVKERVLPETVGHVRTIVPMNRNGLDGSIYVATTRNKVLEGSLQLKFKVIIQGHVEELWAVESHPFEETFVSAGHDQSVVKWSAVSHAPVWKIIVENPCTSISIDRKGRLIALGTTAGKVVILNSSSGVHLTTLMSGTVQINALSFSPDGSQLAVGTFDGSIQIFQVQDEGHNFFRSQTSALKYNNMFIMHLDWSLDSRIIQAVMGDYEIVYWNITTMQRIKSGRSLRDVKWATHNCPIGHSIIGPWHNLDRGDVINVVSQSQNRDLQVVGDTQGRLRLYKWPCSVPKAGYRQTKVYSSNVTCACFTCQDGYLITSGGNDAALMQFSVLDTANAR